jgi:hypothetical protein
VGDAVAECASVEARLDDGGACRKTVLLVQAHTSGLHDGSVCWHLFETRKPAAAVAAAAVAAAAALSVVGSDSSEQ